MPVPFPRRRPAAGCGGRTAPVRALAAIAIALALLPPSARAADEPAPAARVHAHWHSKPEAVAALQRLREGGNLVVFRHAKTDMLARDARGGDWADCSWQRNLSPAGREAAREMGEAFRLLGIRVDRVVSSPYCRCVDTARLAFGTATLAPELAPSPDAAPGTGMRKAGDALRALADRPVAAGVNDVVVAHIFNALGAFGAIPEEGEALVVRPDAGGPRVIARLTMTQWGDLVRDLLVFGLDPADDHRLDAEAHRHHAR